MNRERFTIYGHGHGAKSMETNHPAIYPDESGTIYHLRYAQYQQ